MNRVKLNEGRNPYNFSLPINDPDLLSGRASQLADVAYYLNDAQHSERPVSLAILGDRASGKTSLLNALDQRAKQRGFLVARIDLNEGDVAHALCFFQKLFHALFSAALESPKPDGQGDGFLFEGKDGKTAETYYSMITTLTTPESKLFCPFNFPLFYVRAMAANALQIPVPEDFLRQDFELIATSADRPVALLFDECDVLAKNRILLQMMRNIFMHLKRFLLVLTGTSSLLEHVDDVFSPIIRQFKKIEVGPFTKDEQTSNCLLRPLETLKDIKPDAIFDFDDKRLIKDIHDFTGGKPYEIQLLGHFMFKRVQLGSDQKMLLSSDVLDTVRLELGTGNDLAGRPIFVRVKAYDVATLKQLSLFLHGERFMTLDDVFFTANIRTSGDVISRDDIQSAFDRFVADGMLRPVDHSFEFAGDELDRIYAKYYAKARRVLLVSNARPADIAVIQRLRSCFVTATEGTARFLQITSIPQKMDGLVALLQGKWDSSLEELSNAVISDIYETAQSVSRLDVSEARVVDIELTSPRIKVNDCVSYDAKKRGEVIAMLKKLEEHVQACGGSIAYNESIIRVSQRHDIARVIAAHGAQELRDEVATYHNNEATFSYTRERDPQTALHDAEIIVMLRTQTGLLNAGYILLQAGRYDEAAFALIEAAKLDNDDVAIAEYDLGILTLLRHDYHASLEHFKKAQKLGVTKSFTAAVLNTFLLRDDGSVHLSESFAPDFLSLCSKAISDLEEITSQ